MLESQEQTEQERRKAYLGGFKAGLEALYSMISEGAQRGAAFQAVLRFHDQDLYSWSVKDLAQDVPAPAVIVKRWG